MKIYTAEETRTNAKRIWNIIGVITSEINAPRIVPGIHIKPNLKPIPYSILFCFAYVAVEATALLNTANKLLLAANAGGNPAKVITGTAIIPPPRPIIEPKTPAAKPSGINQRKSIIIIKSQLFYSWDM